MPTTGKGWLRTTLLGLCALAVAIYAAWEPRQTRHEQFDESLQIRVDTYLPQNLEAGVACGPFPVLMKPYRVTIINTGHVPLTIMGSDVYRESGGQDAGGASMQTLMMSSASNESTPLPLQLDAGDVRSYVAVLPYSIAPVAATILCNPLNPGMSRSEMVRALVRAKIDLLGKPIHPAEPPQTGPAFLLAGDLSNLPPLRIFVRTANGKTQTYSFTDKASL